MLFFLDNYYLTFPESLIHFFRVVFLFITLKIILKLWSRKVVFFNGTPCKLLIYCTFG